VDPNSGRWEFYVMSEGVVRYSIDPDLSPPGESGKPVESLPARRGVVRNAGDDSLPALALKAP
jgi:hypothetical protein